MAQNLQKAIILHTFEVQVATNKQTQTWKEANNPKGVSSGTWSGHVAASVFGLIR